MKLLKNTIRSATAYLAALLTITLVCATAPITAQDKTPQAKTAGKADVNVTELGHMLKPLTKSELEVEAGAWIKLLQAKATEVSQKQIEALNAEGAAKTTIVDEISKLQEERTRLKDRVSTVLSALEAKGGDIAELDQYVATASSMDIDTGDASAAMTAITNWLVSEEGGIRWGINIALFLLVLIAFKILSGILGRITGRAVNRMPKASDMLKKFCVNFVKRLTFFVGFVLALTMIEVPIGPFLAVIGAAGFVVGFALQGTLSNFAAGIMILIYRPYDAGDVVTVAGVTGCVEDMSIVSTKIKTPDNQTIIVPNGSIFGGVITNITGNPTRRVDMTFGIGYDDDIEKAQSVLEEIVNAHELVHKDPAPVVKLHELADSSVNFVVRAWSNTSDYWAVYWDVTRTVKERFDREGLSIPYPQTDIHVHQSGPQAKSA